jgi:hypothetical protein
MSNPDFDFSQTHRYNRTGKLERLILIGHTGFVTLDALRWLRDGAPHSSTSTRTASSSPHP